MIKAISQVVFELHMVTRSLTRRRRIPMTGARQQFFERWFVVTPAAAD
jgi:hypothetical protein